MSQTSKFNPTTDLPSLLGKVIIVTGANTGIGYTTVRNLARKGAKVYLGSRSEEKGKAAVKTLHTEGITPGQVLWLECDIGSPALATAAAERFKRMEDKLDILINNAAWSVVAFSFMTLVYKLWFSTYDDADKPGQDGITQMMMTNHIGTFQFTMSLLPLLRTTSELPNSDVRVVTLASSAHIDYYPARDPKLDFSSLDSFRESYANDRFSFISRYSVSKLANIHFSSALQKRVPKDIICISLHPGTVKSTFASGYRFYSIMNFLIGLIGLNVDEGSFTTCFAAASPLIKESPEKYAGKYLVPFGVLGDLSTNAKREDLEVQLWQTTEKYLQGCSLD